MNARKPPLKNDLRTLKRRLMRRALKRFGTGIGPCGTKKLLSKCFVIQFGMNGILPNQLQLHYNDKSGSSHIEAVVIPDGELLEL